MRQHLRHQKRGGARNFPKSLRCDVIMTKPLNTKKNCTAIAPGAVAPPKMVSPGTAACFVTPPTIWVKNTIVAAMNRPTSNEPNLACRLAAYCNGFAGAGLVSTRTGIKGFYLARDFYYSIQSISAE
jgi:hypothetical protein